MGNQKLNYLFISILWLLFSATAAAQECYLWVDVPVDYPQQDIADFAVPIISKYVHPVQPVGIQGVGSDACQYKLLIKKQPLDTLGADISGKEFYVVGESPIIGLRGAQQAILHALYQRFPDKQQELCKNYPGLLKQKCGSLISSFFSESEAPHALLKYSILNVHANVPDTKLFINGRAHGSTPQTLRLLPNEFAIEVKKEGYQTFSTRIQLEQTPQEVKVKLQKLAETPPKAVKVPEKKASPWKQVLMIHLQNPDAPRVDTAESVALLNAHLGKALRSYELSLLNEGETLHWPELKGNALVVKVKEVLKEHQDALAVLFSISGETAPNQGFLYKGLASVFLKFSIYDATGQQVLVDNYTAKRFMLDNPTHLDQTKLELEYTGTLEKGMNEHMDELMKNLFTMIAK